MAHIRGVIAKRLTSLNSKNLQMILYSQMVTCPCIGITLPGMNMIIEKRNCRHCLRFNNNLEIDLSYLESLTSRLYLIL